MRRQTNTCHFQSHSHSQLRLLRPSLTPQRRLQGGRYRRFWRIVFCRCEDRSPTSAFSFLPLFEGQVAPQNRGQDHFNYSVLFSMGIQTFFQCKYSVEIGVSRIVMSSCTSLAHNIVALMPNVVSNMGLKRSSFLWCHLFAPRNYATSTNSRRPAPTLIVFHRYT
jgi:hypothetical protein